MSKEEFINALEKTISDLKQTKRNSILTTDKSIYFIEGLVEAYEQCLETARNLDSVPVATKKGE